MPNHVSAGEGIEMVLGGYQEDSSQGGRQMQVGGPGEESLLPKEMKGPEPIPEQRDGPWPLLLRQVDPQDLHQGTQQLCHQGWRLEVTRGQPRGEQIGELL